MAELESKQTLPRSEIAEYLHEFADEFDTDPSATVSEVRSPDEPIDEDERDDSDAQAGIPTDDEPLESTSNDESGMDSDATDPEERVTLIVGDDSATVHPPDAADFEIEVDSDSSLVQSGEQQRVTFELEWKVEETPGEEDMEVT